MHLITKGNGTQFLTRITFSDYPNLGRRVNYFVLNIQIILTKQEDCGRLRSVISNGYILAVI